MTLLAALLVAGVLGAPPAPAALPGPVGTASTVAAATVTGSAAPAADDPPDLSKFQKVVLGQGNALGEVMELTVAQDGRVFFITRAGDIQMYDPTTGSIEIIMLNPGLGVWSGLEDGGLGITLDPEFATNGWMYVYYAPLPASYTFNRLARVTVEESADGEVFIDKASEKVILEVGTQRNICCHSAGSLQFGPDGTLHLATGDNTSSSDNGGFSPHDERPGRNDYDAQDSAGSTNDLRGKILRVRPRADDAGDVNPTPGDAISYDIPDGNLFGEGGAYPTAKYPDADPAKTRPEIYVMGLRNPYRLGVDPDTDVLYWGEVGPDSRTNNANRGPRHQEEFNRTEEAMNGGWPYCGGEVGDDLTNQGFGGAYVDWDFVADRFKTNPDGTPKRFPCNDPDGMDGVNDSPNSTGLTDLPPMTDAWIPYSTSAPFKYPQVEGSTPSGAQVYRQSRNTTTKDTAFPAYYEGSVFISEMSRGWIKEVRVDENGAILSIDDFMSGFFAPGDMEFGPDGSMYVLEYGSGFFSGSPDTKLVRIDYAVNGQAPQARAAADPAEGGVPLDVDFSSAGTVDPDGDTLTYAWDFDQDGTPDSTDANPSHTFDAAGDYAVVLTVTDSTGKAATAQVIVNVGNTRPTLDIQAPVDGGFFDSGDDVAFDVDVNDAEETVDCDEVVVSEGLGHDAHVHPNLSVNGCTGIMRTAESTDHGPDANTYGVIGASYADGGGNGGANEPLTGQDIVTLQPKLRQAEHAAGRNGVGSTGYDDKSGTRPGGGGIITGMGNGNSVSFTPMSLVNMTSISVTYSGSPAAGAAIEARAGSATGPVAARIPLDGATQGLYYYKTVTADITDRSADEGGRPLFFVYTGGGEVNFDEVRFAGTGVASNVAPTITDATATPDDGAAPLEVDFAATANDPDGDAISYAWDFGVEGTDTDVSEDQNPTYTYTEPGRYTATVTATDATDKSSERTVDVVVRRACTTPPTPDPGYELLFNGRDLEGWDQAGPGGFTVEDCAMTSFGGLGLLWNTEQQYDDYVMKMQFKLSDDGDNSGVFTRFPDPGDDPFVAVDEGHEIQIKEGAPNDEPQKTGSVYNFDREDARNANPVGEWNDYEVRVVGQTYVMTLNGVEVNRYTSDGSRGTTGFVGLQNHGNADAVSFRNVQIQELDVDEPFVNTVTVAPTEGPAPLAVTFTAEGVDRQGDELSYEWDFGDGSDVVTAGAETGHTYADEGSYTATVTPIDADGTRGATVEADEITVLTDPVPLATATPSCGIAPVEVAFTGSATDPQGQSVTYAWDFGVDGDADTSTEQNPTFTYTEVGVYTATLTVTDPDGNTGTTSVAVRAIESGECRSVADLGPFFNNDAISTHANPGDGNFDGGGWAFAAELLPEAVRETGGAVTLDGVDYEFPSPADGELNSVEANGQTIPLPSGRFDQLKILGSAHNGDVQAPATVTYSDGTTSQVQLRFTDWAVAPKFGETIAVDMAHRHNSAGDTSPRVYIWGQSVFVEDKDLASITLPVDPKLHLLAISAVVSDEEPPCGQRRSDEFDDTDLLDNCNWNVRRADDALYEVGDGSLSLQAGPGEYATAPNVITQPAPAGPWSVTSKVTFDPSEPGQQAGLVVAGAGSSGFAKLMFVRKSAGGNEWIEFLKSSSPANDFDFSGDWHTGGGSFDGPFLPTDFPTTFWLRFTSDGTDLTGWYSTDGETFTQVGDPRALAGIESPRVGVMALRGDASAAPNADYDFFRFASEQPGPEVEIGEPTMTSCSRSDDFATALSTERWDSIQRHQPDLYDVTGGNLEIQTGPGELQETAPNLILQTMPETGGFTAVTKLNFPSTAEGQQAGLVIAEPDTNSYLKLAFVNKGSGNRWVEFLRVPEGQYDFSGNWHSGPGGDFSGPFLPGDFPEAIYLRLSSGDGETFRGEYSVDGETWESAGDARQGFGDSQAVGPYALRGPGSDIATGTFEWFVAAPERECADDVDAVVDAVDDANGARWVAEETGTSTVTIAVGDTVEWQFDRAAQSHDLTSRNTASTWDPPVTEFRDPNGEPIRYTFTEPGTYEYICSIHGATMSGTVVVEEPDNEPPTAEPYVADDSGDRTGPAPLYVHFEANAEDADGDDLTYEWDFGDGTPGSTSDHAHHTYAQQGRYTASLTVDDGNGGVYQEDFQIVATGDAPLVSASVTPLTGTAPLTVNALGQATDDQGGPLTYQWDFGVPGTDADVFEGGRHGWTYVDDGTYTAVFTATDPQGNVGRKQFEVVVGDGGGDEMTATATATPTSGQAPLSVQFSSAVTNAPETEGQFSPIADGVTAYPELEGDASLHRMTGMTHTMIDVTGLKPNAPHMVHVHEQACGNANGGAHYRFDEDLPFSEANEIWLPFTSDADGASGVVEVASDQRAGAKAVAIVIHDPDNPAKRIGCVDLVPSGLTYAWDFGDGETGEGADPEHTYTEAGTYTATVTASSHHGEPAVAEVVVVVEGVVDTEAPQTTLTGGPSGTVRTSTAVFRLGSSEPGSTFACSIDGTAFKACASPVRYGGLRDGGHELRVRAVDAAGNADPSPVVRRWVVDSRGPTIRATGPTGRTRDRTPTVRADVTDQLSTVDRKGLTLRLDGRIVGSLRWDARRDRLTWTSKRPMAFGKHYVRLVAIDAAGNRTVKTWQFTIRR